MITAREMYSDIRAAAESFETTGKALQSDGAFYRTTYDSNPLHYQRKVRIPGEGNRELLINLSRHEQTPPAQGDNRWTINFELDGEKTEPRGLFSLHAGASVTTTGGLCKDILMNLNSLISSGKGKTTADLTWKQLMKTAINQPDEFQALLEQSKTDPALAGKFDFLGDSLLNALRSLTELKEILESLDDTSELAGKIYSILGPEISNKGQLSTMLFNGKLERIDANKALNSGLDDEDLVIVSKIDALIQGKNSGFTQHAYLKYCDGLYIENVEKAIKSIIDAGYCLDQNKYAIEAKLAKLDQVVEWLPGQVALA